MNKAPCERHKEDRGKDKRLDEGKLTSHKSRDRGGECRHEGITLKQ